jgi:hypothetical protein
MAEPNGGGRAKSEFGNYLVPVLEDFSEADGIEYLGLVNRHAFFLDAMSRVYDFKARCWKYTRPEC